jgi:hypothetical protein
MTKRKPPPPPHVENPCRECRARPAMVNEHYCEDCWAVQASGWLWHGKRLDIFERREKIKRHRER